MNRIFSIFKSLVGAAFVAAIVLTMLIKSEMWERPSHYVGSESCADCHSQDHSDWQSSWHAKMMRRVDAEGVVVADLGPNSDVIFDPQDAVWAIGSKVEQQFMGEVDGEQTLLPGAWQVEHAEWMVQGWDGWQVPVPLERCHGCHTVGLDVETGSFVEASIGCESCHGPASWHSETLGLGKVYSGLESEVCGQCHTRGRAKDNTHFFPVDYRVGESLDSYYTELEPDPLQNTSQWWANGHPRKRHQQFFGWKQGGHANSLNRLIDQYDGRYGEVEPECLTCHAAEAALAGAGHEFELDDVSNPITCSVCHNSHGELEAVRVECSSCHQQGAFFHAAERNLDHVPCPTEAEVGCIDCHMPKTVWNAGDYRARTHTPGIIPPSDTEQWGVPSSCANSGCHADRSLEWLNVEFAELVTP